MYNAMCMPIYSFGSFQFLLLLNATIDGILIKEGRIFDFKQKTLWEYIEPVHRYRIHASMVHHTNTLALMAPGSSAFNIAERRLRWSLPFPLNRTDWNVLFLFKASGRNEGDGGKEA